jgi:hypothetical protein
MLLEVGIGSVLAVFVYGLYNSSKQSRRQLDSQEHLAELFTSNNEKTDSVTTPVDPEGIVGRLEELERRMEKLHKDSLRYLQQGTQRHRRAQELSGLEEDEDSETLEQIPIPDMSNNVTPDQAHDDLEWGKAQLSKQGVQPI